MLASMSAMARNYKKKIVINGKNVFERSHLISK